MLKIDNLEKKARRAVTFEDGLWDIYFGLALIFAGLYAHYKIKPFILMTPILIIAVSLAKHYITVPRMGYARIKLPALKRVLIWILLLLIPFVIISPVLYKLRNEEEQLYRTYLAGLLEARGEAEVYPDANRTMRLSFGHVSSYEPSDGVHYFSQTTMKGMMEKFRLDPVEYPVPERLKQLYEKGDSLTCGAGPDMPLCFIASNHTSGGNSGSPVLDARGRLIGLNFDRGWEGTMSDIHYDPGLCRNIAVDIRYVLFIIDKFAGAGHLLQEMDITR